MNKENLLKMADYIEAIPPEKFDMAEYRMGSSKEIKCGSVGCVIGHCTALDAKNVRNNFIDEDNQIEFTDWSEQFTGLVWGNGEWEWCFNGEWAETDNTPSGAAKRIRYLVENGLPDNWREQIQDDSPLCY